MAASVRSYGYQAPDGNARSMSTATTKTATTAANAARWRRSAAPGRGWPRSAAASTAMRSANASGEKPSDASTARPNPTRQRRWMQTSAAPPAAAPARNG